MVAVIVGLIGVALGQVTVVRKDRRIEEDINPTGPYWTSWTDLFGCFGDETPFANPADTNQALSGASNFCNKYHFGVARDDFKTKRFRICTLPSIKSDAVFKYEDATITADKYYSDDFSAPASQYTPNHKLWGTISQTLQSTGRNDWRDYKPPTGGNFDRAEYLTKDKARLYSERNLVASDRVACDPRLQDVATKCIDDAIADPTLKVCEKQFGREDLEEMKVSFEAGDIEDKCSTVVCSPSFNPNLGLTEENKQYYIEGLVLLFEDEMTDGSSNGDLAAKILGATRTHETMITQEGVCCENTASCCPSPTEWSEWSCYCEISATEPNTNNLPLCGCSATAKRTRVKGCSVRETESENNNEEFSCEIYQSIDPTQEVCDGIQVKDVMEITDVWTSASSNATKEVINALTYDGNTFTDVQKDLLSKTFLGEDNPNCDDIGITSDEFEYGTYRYLSQVENCANTKVEMREDWSVCSKTCGCGTKTKTRYCVRTEGPNIGVEVQPDEEDFKCGCEPKSVETWACNTECCPEWHQHAASSLFSAQQFLAALPDNDYEPGIDLTYSRCDEVCGPEPRFSDLRCMCRENVCVDDYAVDVKGVVKGPVTWTRADTSSCGFTNINAGFIAITELPPYRISYEKDCGHPCCVEIKTTQKICPPMKCDQEYDAAMAKSLPFYLNADECTVNVLKASNKQCQCVAPGAVVTQKVAKCTEGGRTYDEGEFIDASAGDPCSYKRKDYMKYDDRIEQLTTDTGDYDYFCCTAETASRYFEEWSEWSECEFSPSWNAECAQCAQDPNERCGWRSRNREWKCPLLEHRIDENNPECQCLETQKCDMPICPKLVETAPDYCLFNPIQTDLGAYMVGDVVEDESYRKSVTYKDGASVVYDKTDADCKWLECDEQVQPVASKGSCPRFELKCKELPWSVTDSNMLIWGSWGECMPLEAECGAGERSRERICKDENGNEHPAEICYKSSVTRTIANLVDNPNLIDMKNHPDFYEAESCYVLCKNDLKEWKDWSPCSLSFGVGSQYREATDGTVDIRSCEGEQGVTPPSLDDEVKEFPCQAPGMCGEGKKLIVTISYKNNMKITTREESCVLPNACPSSTVNTCDQI